MYIVIIIITIPFYNRNDRYDHIAVKDKEMSFLSEKHRQNI